MRHEHAIIADNHLTTGSRISDCRWLLVELDVSHLKEKNRIKNIAKNNFFYFQIISLPLVSI